MRDPRLEQLRLSGRPAHPATSRAWREWCFLQVVWRHFRVRLLIIVLVVLAGAWLFRLYAPEEHLSMPKAMFYTWSLVFGEPPADFPSCLVLQGLYFVMPVVGLIVILEGLLDFALMLRDRRRNERSWCNVMAASFTNHVILVGFGKLGYRSFWLLRRLGEAVVVIERDGGNEFLEDVRRDGSPLLVGDARREALLADANAAQAKSIVLATDNDLANLEIALDARRINPNIRVIMRMFDQNMADKVHDGFAIQAAMSESAISAPAFVMAAVDDTIVNSLVLNGELVVMQRWFVHEGGPLCGKSVARVMRDWNVGVVERTPRGGQPLLMPLPNTRLVEGDELLVQGTYQVLNQLRHARPNLTTADPDRDELAAIG